MSERLKQLISPRLWAVYIPSESLYIPNVVPYDNETAASIGSYYSNISALQEVIDVLQEAGVPSIELYPMWDVINMLANDEFYIGNGVLVWTEIGGDGVPDDVTRMGFDNR